MGGECIARLRLVDFLRQRLGRRKLVSYGGILASLSCFIGVTANVYPSILQIPIATIAFFFLGVGTAPLIPVAFSSGGHSSENTSAALSTVAFCTDFGSVVGPFIIGLMSSVLGGLQASMMFASCLISLIIFIGYNLPSDPEHYHKGTDSVVEEYKIVEVDENESNVS